MGHYTLCSFIPIVRGISSLVTLLTLRLFIPGIHDVIVPEPSLLSILGLVISLYVIYASRALIFIFTFNCRLLRHCFKAWNERLKHQLFLEEGIALRVHEMSS